LDQWLLIGLFTFISSLIGTVSGFGLSTLMIPVLSLFYPFSIVLLFVGIIHLFGDIWKIIFFRKGADWKLILLFGIPGILFSYLGATLSVGSPEVLLKRLLGGFLLLYVFFLFLKQNWKIPANNHTSVMGGSLSGFFAGIFGVGGAVRGAFLAAFNLPKERYIFTSGMIALFIDITRISKYLASGTILSKELFYFLLGGIPLSLLGAFTARKIVNKVPQHYFRLVIALFLGLIALKFLIFS